MNSFFKFFPSYYIHSNIVKCWNKVSKLPLLVLSTFYNIVANNQTPERGESNEQLI